MRTKLLPFLVLLVFAGCYPYTPTYTQQYDLILTDHDPNFTFTTRHTYSLPDSIVIVTGDKVDNPNAPLQFVNPATAVQIFSAIRTNMNGRGWTEVNRLQGPDVMLMPAVMQTTYLYYYYDWCYYWYWYDPYCYGWYYPGYYPGTVSGYSTGTLLVSMVDPKNVTPDQELPVAWSMVINGLLTGDASSVTTRITSNINQAFTQSPYLDLNQ
jgi:Domain of unknown function (DUF4136)